MLNSLDKSIKTTNKSKQEQYTIVIDAGHGGVDAGAIGVDGCLEKDINLSIALILYDYLMVSGISSKLIRAGDYEIYNTNETRNKSDLYNRLDYVNSINNSILISIHQNKYNNENEWGTQIWYSPNNLKSNSLATNIIEIIKTNIQPNNNRENKESDSAYYILYKALAPSIMIECGFISNREECLKLQTKEYQKELSYSILVGVSKEV